MSYPPILTIAFIWRENMLGYLSADIICSEKRTVFPERSSRKTVSFEEQIMSKDKYPSIFSQPNWGYCVYYPSVLKIGEYPRTFPSFSWRIFARVTRLDQSRASENIWWIINNVIHPLNNSGLGSVSRKSRELFGPEKPVVKLRPAYSVKLVFSYVVKGIKIKITAKFRASRRLRFEDTKRIMSPEIRPKSFGTFEKQAPGLENLKPSLGWISFHIILSSAVYPAFIKTYSLLDARVLKLDKVDGRGDKCTVFIRHRRSENSISG